MAPRLSERLAAKENEAIQMAIAESVVEEPQTSSTSGKQSGLSTAAEKDPQNPPPSNMVGIPESVGDMKADNVQPRRVNPKRHAATLAAGSYALVGELSTDDTDIQMSSEAPVKKFVARKRRGPNKATAQNVKRPADPAEAEAKVAVNAATLSKKREPTITEYSKKATKRIKTSRAGLDFDSLAIQVVDNDEKDEDFSPGTRNARPGKGALVPKQYSLRRREGTSLLVEHAEKETTETSRRIVSKPGNSAVMRTSKEVMKKKIRTEVTGSSTRVKQAVKQRRATEAKASLSHVSSSSKQVTKKKPVRMIGPFTNRYKIRFGYTPFPHNSKPTAAACHTVFDLLKKHHEPDNIRLERYPNEQDGLSNDAVDGPMHAGHEVTFNAIVKTILSQATNNENAQMVEQTLINRFRYNFLGLKVKGEIPNYHAMHKAPISVLAKALASGGLHNIKARQIKACLEHVYNNNMERSTAKQRLQAEQISESTDFVPGMLSLDYMMPMSLQEKFDYLVSMPGIGIKTAACILSFNFEYPLFAVDTHVMRLSRMLRWLPLNASSEDHAFMHLDKRVPDELKYGLHQAFWHHGQICIRCKAGSTPKTKGWDDAACPLGHLVDRSRKAVRKAKDPSPSKDEDAEKPKKVKKVKNVTKVKRPPTILPHSKLTAAKAVELGYELRTIVIDDGFGVRRSNFKSKPLLKWVLKSEDADTDEDIQNEVAEPEDLADGMLDDGAEGNEDSAGVLLNANEDEDVTDIDEEDVISDSEVSDVDEDIEEAESEMADDE